MIGLGGVGYLNMLILDGVGYGAGSNPLAGVLRPVCFLIVALRPQLNQSIYICALASREFYIYKLFQVYIVNQACIHV